MGRLLRRKQTSSAQNAQTQRAKATTRLAPVTLGARGASAGCATAASPHRQALPESNASGPGSIPKAAAVWIIVGTNGPRWSSAQPEATAAATMCPPPKKKAPKAASQAFAMLSPGADLFNKAEYEGHVGNSVEEGGKEVRSSGAEICFYRSSSKEWRVV